MSALVNGNPNNQYTYLLPYDFFWGPASLSLWVNPTYDTFDENYIFFSGETEFAWVEIYMEQLIVYWVDADYGGKWIGITYEYFGTINQWYHIGISVDPSPNRSGSDLKIYIDGDEANYYSRTFSLGYDTWDSYNTFVVGGSPGNSTPLIGQVAELAVWQKALSSQQFISLYNGLSPYMYRDRLICYCPFINNTVNLVDTYRGSRTASDAQNSFYTDPIRRHFPSSPKSDFYTFKWWTAPTNIQSGERPGVLFLGADIINL